MRAGHVGLILEAARRWFDEDRSLFEYRGGQPITGVFPGFSDRMEELLLEDDDAGQGSSGTDAGRGSAGDGTGDGEKCKEEDADQTVPKKHDAR